MYIYLKDSPCQPGLGIALEQFLLLCPCKQPTTTTISPLITSTRCLRGKEKFLPASLLACGSLLASLAGQQGHTLLCAHSIALVEEATCWLSGTYFPHQPQVSASLPHLTNQIWPKVDHGLYIMFVWSAGNACEETSQAIMGKDAECLKKPKSREPKDIGGTRVLYRSRR